MRRSAARDDRPAGVVRSGRGTPRAGPTGARRHALPAAGGARPGVGFPGPPPARAPPVRAEVVRPPRSCVSGGVARPLREGTGGRVGLLRVSLRPSRPPAPPHAHVPAEPLTRRVPRPTRGLASAVVRRRCSAHLLRVRAHGGGVRRRADGPGDPRKPGRVTGIGRDTPLRTMYSSYLSSDYLVVRAVRGRGRSRRGGRPCRVPTERSPLSRALSCRPPPARVAGARPRALPVPLVRRKQGSSAPLVKALDRPSHVLHIRALDVRGPCLGRV